MARFSACMVLIALIIVLLAAATTAEIVNPGRESQRCRQQIERQRLSSCREYLIDSSRPVMMEGGNQGRSWREEFPRCCEELERIDEQCRCQAVQQVVQQERQGGELQGRELQEMLQTAQSLPSLCRISPRYCQNMGEVAGPMF
ncbi:2S albumin [Sesamum indicum]|uniref:2S albumin n=1 Tax=Sesamum indicum TaxID=4182 RepID=Q8VX62_SESIN|nr:2S albumin [Sesamum indicum]CAC84134.1 precursor of thiamin-binding protein [Sesamum indicum]